MLRLFVSPVVMALVLIVGCSPSGDHDFSRKPREEQLQILKTLPIQRQIPLYLESMGRLKPPPMEQAVEIARGGEKSASAIAIAIKTSQDIEDRNALLQVLLSMRDMGVYDPCGDDEIRKVIAPRSYGSDNAEAGLRYALSFIELCLEASK